MKTILHVSTSAIRRRGQRSTFPTIEEAAAAGARAGAQELDVRIHPGHHAAELSLDRPLTIAGQRHRRAATVLDLSIENLAGHHLKLSDLTIEGPHHHGIAHAGGLLELQRVAFKETSAAPGSPFRKARIEVALGAMLEARDLVMDSCTFTAIRLTGQSTRAVLSLVNVTENRIPPEAINNGLLRMGAIEVSQNATLLIENSYVADNDYIGIYIYSGGQMHLRRSQVACTRAIRGTDSNFYFGDNILATSGATVELRDFIIRGAEGTGIELDEAYLTAEEGKVKENVIGISAFSPPELNYDSLGCIFDSVDFIDNQVKVGTGSVPLPTIGHPDRTHCRRVPWA